MEDILDATNLKNNSTKFEYYEIKPQIGARINDTSTFTITSDSLAKWEIPSLSYLDVEGQLVKQQMELHILKMLMENFQM